MAKILFIPFSVLGGFLAGMLGTKVFEFVWALIDDQEPPDESHRDASWAKILPALALQGAIFRVARGIADRSARTSFYRATGVWPGEERPDEA